MNDKKAEKVVEKHYERRLMEAKIEMLKEAGPVMDFFIHFDEQCRTMASKHKISPSTLKDWTLDQLPIYKIRDSEDDEEEMEDDE